VYYYCADVENRLSASSLYSLMPECTKASFKHSTPASSHDPFRDFVVACVNCKNVTGKKLLDAPEVALLRRLIIDAMLTLIL
jgi:formate-dependent nitrite reductase cytochrome c552 subunit